ncbi:MAG: Rieske (2Fe-2S) protein [Acetobacteraceae bacterium]|nr:Rieske (2Fe-2S) protein [Acetobacteraceae bacterium]
MSGQDPLPGFAPALRALCRIDEIPDGGARGFPGPPGSFTGLFAIRRGRDVFVYVNACPHIGTPLNLVGDRFLSRDGARVVCVTHGAEFRIEDGFCLLGPCQGDRLEAVEVRIEDGTVRIPADAGR